jgi:uncharacterized OsmC-like protein
MTEQMMADLRARPIGATASLGKTGYPHIQSETGGTIDIVTGVSEPGFNPLDLLLASLAACMSMSARIAARELGLTDRMSGVTARASGEKAKEGPSRFQALTVVFRFEGSLDAAEQFKVAHRAEEVCTVSNTLAVKPEIVLAPA